MTSVDRQRRTVIRLISSALLCTIPGMAGAANEDRATLQDPGFIALERASGGRLGVCALDSETGRSIGLRADERFGMCSTFKLLLAAVILREADAGRLSLDTLLTYGKADMVPHAPVTERHLHDGGMSIGALAQAAQMNSDNVAANLLLRQLGGPSRFTELLRELGDPLTRLDRWEPDMNLVPAGEARDTTSPRAMAQSVARLFNAGQLSVSAQERLRDWMIATDTGKLRLRAGMPIDWIVGDKTGTGIAPSMANKHNDVAVIWLPRRKPIVIAAYFEARAHFNAMRAEDDAVLAAVGSRVAGWVEASV